MGSIIDLNGRRHRRSATRAPATRVAPSNLVVCVHCSERHPIVRLQGGESRCVTAFFDGAHWFCLNRGCRRAWLERQAGRPA